MEADSLTILADHDVEGYAIWLWGTLAALGWLELVPLRLAMLKDIDLPVDSVDREVWRFAQANGMILLTNNRNMDTHDSLEQTLRDENRLDSLPVLTFGRLDRLSNRDYREQCADRLIDIVINLERYRGRGRLYIP